MAIEAFLPARGYGVFMPEPGERAVRFELAAFGELLADPSRVAMLLALMDGTTRPASELARAAGITAATASTHLARLVKGGLLAVEPIGRHRFYRLASSHVADAFESLMTAMPHRPLSRTPSELAYARTCYRHLAGEVGVKWLAALESRRFVAMEAGRITLQKRGIAWFDGHGIHEASWPAGKPCLDWTERRYHLGGSLGVVLTEHLLTRRWLARRKTSRALRVTAEGERALTLE